ncbi:peptidylprolyl isomerase [Aerophototrophica crusticola]|uniref:Parvulin-like PPIase n=1 Tax=Aerophototrophica crusticola TaxID=1709002 RepID=A0A858R8V6_9PROT|nr:peptidylprolyl isomerase [Rhodospirillaceae bacterium B3]
MASKTMRAALTAAALTTAAGMALFAAHAQTPAPAGNKPAANAPAPAAEDVTVAKVNGKEIKRSEVISFLQQLGPQAQQIPLQQAYPLVIDQLVATRLVSDAGYKAKLQDSAEVKEQLKRAEEQFVQQAYLRKEIDAKLTDAVIKKKYDEYVKANPPQDEVRARHILVKDKAEAEALIKQIAGGADFAKLAGEKGTDGTKDQGGDLGYFTKDQMVAPFAEAAFAMKAGEVSKTPVQTEFGFHVIKVEDKRKQTLPTFEQAKGELRAAAAQDIAEEVVANLRKTAKVETFDLEGKPLPAAPAPAADAPAGGQKPKQ